MDSFPWKKMAMHSWKLIAKKISLQKMAVYKHRVHEITDFLGGSNNTHGCFQQ